MPLPRAWSNIQGERITDSREEKRLKTKKKSSNCWKQSGNRLEWLSCTAEATKGAETMSAEETVWLTRWQKGQQKN
jgi:hypothetical protein